ncbi:MAG TPA: 1-deoxy-D-xylulose-5-phosphate synthase [Acidimicrobiales bacterium]|nr:1-deoxy-D-xylulose-5-phosphate synthase [Acidimicrobiales bacterium]
MILEHIDSPADLRPLNADELSVLSKEIREFIVEAVTATGGHLGSNLGVVELTLALHRTFDSPRDILLWDTGHQAYVHKLITGRRDAFSHLRQEDGLSGYPNRTESEHDWVENSHASAILSYAHGMATALELQASDRRVVAVVGDGALTGGMAYEALNNLGHSGKRVVIVLNDNGRSYAPTVSQLSLSLTHLRLNPAYIQARQRLRTILRDLPGVGELAVSGIHGLTSALREVVTPHTFFEALGIRYVGPIEGHEITGLEQALANASEWEGPIVVHVLTQKGRGYAPAEEDEIQRLHDVKVAAAVPAAVPAAEVVDAAVDDTPAVAGVAGVAASGVPAVPGSLAALQNASLSVGGADLAPDVPVTTYTHAFTRALLIHAEADPRIMAITAAMPGPTGLLPFQARFPDRFIDVGIAEQHAVTAAAGMAMVGLRPVVAVYSTFFSRAFDQANLDVGLHKLPVVLVLDRAGITGDDGPSHHGVLDFALTLAIPGMTVFAPSSAPEVEAMLATALTLEGPSVIRFPKTPAPEVVAGTEGSGLDARLIREGDGSVCILAVGKTVAAATSAAERLADEGIDVTVWDPRVVSHPDPAMLADAGRHALVLTVEDGIRQGGAGMFMVDALRASLPLGTCPPVIHRGTPRSFVAQGRPDRILARLGLDTEGIVRTVRESLAALQHPSELRGPVASPKPASGQATAPAARPVDPQARLTAD